MDNPFKLIDSRLSTIENLILDLKHQPKSVETKSETEKFLSVQECSKLLMLSVATIYSKVSKRELPSIKRGKRLYFQESELKQYLKDGHRKSNDQTETIATNYLSNSKKSVL